MKEKLKEYLRKDKELNWEMNGKVEELLYEAIDKFFDIYKDKMMWVSIEDVHKESDAPPLNDTIHGKFDPNYMKCSNNYGLPPSLK